MQSTAPPAVLTRFQLRESDFLGQGGEAWVYALDGGRVLRVLKGDKPDEVEERAAFYARLAGFRFPFAVPELLDSGEAAGTLYTVERRIAGEPLSRVLPTLEPGGEARRRALKNFAGAAGALGAVLLESAFGELYGADRVRGATWPEFLRRRIDGVLARSASGLAGDVPDLPAVLARFAAGVDGLPPVAEPRLAHGDYYPANVLVGPDLTVTGVIDFSRLTVAGDPDLDRVAASLFLDPRITPGARPDDRAIVRDRIALSHGDGPAGKLPVYRDYYALLFSDCAVSDPDTYRWCVQVLNAPPEPP